MCHLRFTIYGFLRRAGAWLTVAALGAGVAGCNDKFFDPTQIGRFRPTPTVNVILDSLGVAEEPPVAWENAEEPRPNDIVGVKTDYVLQPGDLIQISIFELLQEGVSLSGQFLISETGKLSIPDVGVIQAAGLTEVQLEEEIKQILAPNILRAPSVTVTLLNSQQRTFTILGNGVARPNRYVIPRYDFRLMDALATAQAQMQFNVSYVYVSRREEVAGVPMQNLGSPQSGPAGGRTPELELIEPASSKFQLPQPVPAQPRDTATSAPKAEIPEPSESAARFETEREMLDIIAPHAKSLPTATYPAWEATPAPQGGLAGFGPQGDGLGSARVSGISAGPVGQRPPTPTNTLATPETENRATATVMPYGFQLLVPSRPQTLRQAAPPAATQNFGSMQVQSPAEFGTSSPTGSTGGTQDSGSLPAQSDARERIEWIFKDGKWVPLPVPDSTVPSREQPAVVNGPAGQIEWVYQNGRWVPVPKSGSQPVPSPARREEPQIPTLPPTNEPATPPAREPVKDAQLPMELEWEQAIQTRLIRIPADKLLAGDPRYNIIIQPGDTIHVPVDLIGEFYIMGNVNRTGLIPITGRPLTLKMAIAAAGGLGPLAWPKHVEVVRRIGTKKEEIVLVDLDKIASGEQPDFFIKPNDLINVGTEATARWRAVLRNAFRAAYGFGFVYDRNFADADYGTGWPHWF